MLAGQSKRNKAILVIWMVLTSITFACFLPSPIDQNAPMTEHKIKITSGPNIEFFGRLLARSDAGIYAHQLYEYERGYVVIIEESFTIGSIISYANCETKECVIKELEYSDAAKSIYEQMNWNTNLKL